MTNYFVRKENRKLSLKKPAVKSFREYTDLHRVVVLVDIDHCLESVDFVRTLQADGMEVVVYTFNPDKKNPKPELPEAFRCLDPTQMTFRGFPVEGVMNDFLSLRPDTLIDLTLHSHPVLRYLSLRATPSYRVGFHSDPESFGDVLIESDPEQGFLFLVSQLHFYLKSIRTKK
jgi:hypothetical protein